MNLTEGDEGPRRGMAVASASSLDCVDGMQKRSAVAFDGAPGVILGEAEVQIALPVGGGESSHSRGKTMDQPGKFAQVFGAENVEFDLGVCFFVGSPSRHGSMLQEREIQTLNG